MGSRQSLWAERPAANPLLLLPVSEISIARVEALEAALASLQRIGALRPVRRWRPIAGVWRGGPRVKGPSGLSLVRKPQVRRLRRRPSPILRRGFHDRNRRPAAPAWRDRNH